MESTDITTPALDNVAEHLLGDMVFTEAAANKVAVLMAEEGNKPLMLRAYIEGGGCSGFQYGFKFEESASEDDMRVITSGITLLIDPLSYQYLVGAEIDFEEDLKGAQFVIRNPNAGTTCGCGSSFSA
ncbi:MAG: iron-sulfur cluster insertion protein ErpA [Gammaproteobacteria bacterium]|nr:iron-sulfur cluster insertion protein ErpA [Gammaproteobacteria bacterium]